MPLSQQSDPHNAAPKRDIPEDLEWVPCAHAAEASGQHGKGSAMTMTIDELMAQVEQLPPGEQEET